MKPRISIMEATFEESKEQVWNIVTDNTKYAWRSDLSKIEIVDESKFVEYTKEGYQTNFEIVQKEPYQKYAFHMQNKMFHGEWTGEFIELPENKTKIIFTEQIYPKNSIIKLVSYLGMNLKKMQELYVKDLKAELAKNR